MSAELLDLNFIEDQDLSADFVSDEILTNYTIASISFQGIATGSPSGLIEAEISIRDGQWTKLEGCQDISEDLSQTNEFFFVLPDIGDYGSKLRLCWKSGAGSSGLLNVAYRILPR